MLDSLIEEKVLLLAAKEIGIIVKDEELEEAITHAQAFTRNGVFGQRDIPQDPWSLTGLRLRCSRMQKTGIDA